MDNEQFQRHLKNPLYTDARAFWESVQTGQILKGAAKYPEPLNPDSWTAAELIMHAMQENVDQAHYLTALLSKLGTEGCKVPVKVKKLHPDAVIPKYAKPGDSGFDLVAVEDVIVRPGQTVQVPTGLAFSIPEGWELQVRPRSGISKNTKLRVSNAPGTVDCSYRGEVGVLIDNIMVPIFHIRHDGRLAVKSNARLHTLTEKNNYFYAGNLPEGSYIIKKGDRIAQGVIVPVGIADFEESDELDETERGTGAYGSTGTN